ncbi:TonB-dependent receptor [Opitutales bacterium]|nr:TonB-dependent receptor [Opitutales bacterium]
MKILSVPILLASSFAFAQENSNKDAVRVLDALTVESSPLGTKTTDVTQAWSVLSGDELQRSKGLTIAETLSNVPGVSQTQFGPTANRPIIRGMDKFRVRVLQNGTDSFDVSAQSEDHAVPIDPLMVDRIEILRGSSALLHGGSAIGGVVNVIDRSIPTSPYDSPGASLRSSYNSVNDGWNYGAMAFGGSDKLSFQINGFKRDYNDYDAPTFYTEDHHDGSVEGPFNKVKNSHGVSSSVGLGGSYLLDSGFAGFSFSKYQNDYGVPGEHAESDTLIEMESDRFEFRTEIEINDSDWLTGVELNIGYGDYKHSESGFEEENGTRDWHTHSTYLREGFEGRIAFNHEIGDLRGVFGLHGIFDEFKIQGEESILGGLSKPTANNPPISSEDSSKIALFLIEEYDLNEDTTLNAGIRWENIERDYESTISDREDTTFSASGGVSHDLSEIWNISGNLSYSERTPDTAELYSDGAHHATESFEIGNPNLDTESAVGVEVIIRKTVGKVTGQFSAFHTKYNDYVFLEDAEQVRDGEGNLGDQPGPNGTLGDEDDTFASGAEGLPVKNYEAVKAEFQGIEVEVDWLAMESPSWNLMLSAYGDMVRGKNKTESTNLARIPAARLGIGFEVQQEKLDFGMKLTRSLKQDRVAAHGDHSEEPTAAYTVVNAFASYDVDFGDSVGEFFIKGNNLTDEHAYNHSSVLKQYAPLPGRSVELGLKFDF